MRATHDYAGISANNRQIKARGEIHSFEDAERFLAGDQVRTVASHVMVRKVDQDRIDIVLYDTAIITYYRDGSWTADNGGFNTPTTSARATQFGPGVYFYHDNKVLKPTKGICR